MKSDNYPFLNTMRHIGMKLFRFSAPALAPILLASAIWAQAEPPKEFGVTDDTVVATVGGQDLTAKDVETLRAGLPDQMRRSMEGMDHRTFLNAYANIVALDKAAREEGYDQQAPYKQQLEYLQMQFLGEIFMTRYNATLKVPDDVKKDFYDVNSRAYEEVSTSAIYIDYTTSGLTGVKTSDEARALAEKLVAEIRDGADFGELAQKYSDDAGSAEKSGFLGLFNADSELPPALKNTILSLPEGEVSTPIRDNARYYIFRADSRTPRPYEDVKEDIETRLRGLMFRRKLEDVRAAVPVEFKNEEFLSRRPFSGAASPGSH